MISPLSATAEPTSKRCAIYTRKSTEHGIEQDFNSLKAQQAICSAYIQSQQHRGWKQLDKVYEDPAQSGGSLERPALVELLADTTQRLVRERLRQLIAEVVQELGDRATLAH